MQVLSKVKTLARDEPLFRKRTISGCLIFQAPSGSARIVKARTILTDGTFPKIALQFDGLTVSKSSFYQMITVQSIFSPGELRDDQLLMLDAVMLLPDKKRKSYDESFESVIQIARKDCPDIQ